MRGRTLVIATGHALSLALIEGQAAIARHHAAIGLGHAEALLPALRSLLRPFGGARAGIGRILVETGPGSFTGLRIGHAAAGALALAWGADLAGVRSTLLVAAGHAAAAAGPRLAVALRAPRGQLWVERFALPGLESLGPPEALAPAALPAWRGDDPCIADTLPQAADAIRVPPALFSAALPLYVRQQDDLPSA